MQWYRYILVGVLACGAAACAREALLQTSAAPAPAAWQDGSYLGVNELPAPQLIRVAVGISQGRLVSIHLLEHPAWRTPAEQQDLLRLVVESQSTSGLVPRGTGSEQDHLLQAIDNALTKARSEAPAGP
ncbi:MAG: hypothetical protein AB7N91_01935 [Candidatus Tectimicrobiota bacterium]